MAKRPEPETPRKDPKADREARLAEALRANLHRRKAQARERTADDARPEEPEG